MSFFTIQSNFFCMKILFHGFQLLFASFLPLLSSSSSGKNSFLLFIDINLFSRVLAFKQEKLQEDLLRNYGPTSFTGTINENFSNDKTNDKINESLGKK